ncbi:FkbM family methyltransferase [Lacihabitans soyangensis]|uniref:FkbM family methyltransferase n=1 Tax=Lacihabitans soyangensis TaxID=869394 RepID=A0AAE3GZK8_9BACT|nr:FkbM family methyltransferase [Lacihabitans soyangensis]MCP9762214.1 FkbM family methyltransferase [Lacihabitans soyangensis]
MKIPIYKKLIPRSIRLEILKNQIVKNLESRDLNLEEKEVLAFLKSNPLHIFPYAFPEKYKPSDIKIEKDEEKGLLFTLWEGKKLYYKNGHQVKKAQTYFNSLLLEQDSDSPHRYLTEDFDVKEGNVIVDVGAAEGNFSLSVIEKASQVYLFEVEKDWIKALEATFEPWKEKVQIVQKYVSDIDNEQCIKLDTFFAENQRVNFIKADVEGAEAQVIDGANDLIKRQKDLRIAVCTYHRQSDAKELDELLKTKGFKNHFSDKYMIFHYGSSNVVEPPFLRKAVLRAVK